MWFNILPNSELIYFRAAKIIRTTQPDRKTPPVIRMRRSYHFKGFFGRIPVDRDHTAR